MIRHILMVRLTASATSQQLERIGAELAALTCPGRTAFTMGPDLGLRDGNMDLAMVADFTDIGAYQAYDTDPEHTRIRRDLIVPIAERLERCQIEL